jgi:hypothetical protein
VLDLAARVLAKHMCISLPPGTGKTTLRLCCVAALKHGRSVEQLYFEHSSRLAALPWNDYASMLQCLDITVEDAMAAPVVDADDAFLRLRGGKLHLEHIVSQVEREILTDLPPNHFEWVALNYVNDLPERSCVFRSKCSGFPK